MRSPERQALAAAIAAHRAASERLERTQAALTKAEDMRFAAFRVHDDAEGRLAAARGNDGAYLAERLLSGDDLGVPPTRLAQQDVAATAAALDGARAAARQLEAEVGKARTAVEYSTGEVKRKAAQVIGASPVAAQAVADLENAELELVRHGDRVRWLISNQCLAVQVVPPGEVYSDKGFPRRVRDANQRLDRPPTEWRDVLQALRDTSNNTQDWDHLLAALQSDPDAAIPGE